MQLTMMATTNNQPEDFLPESAANCRQNDVDLGQKYPFQVNETVLCYHGPLQYEAKIIRIESRPCVSLSLASEPFYLVHYKGWKSK